MWFYLVFLVEAMCLYSLKDVLKIKTLGFY